MFSSLISLYVFELVSKNKPELAIRAYRVRAELAVVAPRTHSKHTQTVDLTDGRMTRRMKKKKTML